MHNSQRNLVCLLIFFASCFCSLTTIWAQSSGATTGAIVGTIGDETGAVIPGATITVQQLNTNFIQVTTTNAEGTYRLIALPPGKYEIKVESPGFQSEVTHFNLTVGTTALIDINLSIGIYDQFTEVQGSESSIERTERSTNIDERAIANLPIDRREYLDFALTTARVVADRIPPNGTTATSGLSINGQSARGNNITVDGFSNNDQPNGGVRTTFSQEAVREFQVVSDSFSAEFGRALGGVINIVTKSGDNELHGNLFNFVRNDRTSARDVFSANKLPFRQFQFGATLSGPIKKNRSYFFAAFERLSVKQNTIVTIDNDLVQSIRQQGFPVSNGARPFSLGNSLFLGRVDTQLTPQDRLTVRYNATYKYNGSFETFGNSQGGLISETSSGILRLKDKGFTINNLYSSSALNLVNETRFLYGRITQTAEPVDANNPLVQISTPQGNVVFGRNIILPQPSDGRIFQLVDNISLVRGRHNIKFGGDLFFANAIADNTEFTLFKGGFAIFAPFDFSQSSGIPGLPSLSAVESFDAAFRSSAQNGFLDFLSTILPGMAPGFPNGVPLSKLPLPVAFLQGFGNGHASIESKLFSLFYQDDIRITPQLLIKTGLRYDLNRVSSMPTNNGYFSPRIAFAYQPKNLSKLTVRGAYGIFFASPLSANAITVRAFNQGFKVAFLPFPYSVLAYAQPGHHYAESDKIPDEINFIPQLGFDYQFDKNISESYAQQANLTLCLSLDRETELNFSYGFVRGIKLTGLRNINPVVRPVMGDLTASLMEGRIDPTRGDINEIETSFDSYYHSFTVEMRRHLTSNINFLASYTFAKAIDNLSDGIRQDLQPPADPLNFGAERGLSLQDVRHRFVASAVWDLNSFQNRILRNTIVSTIVTLESGAPYNLITDTDLNMNNLTGDRPNGIGRNTGIKPGFANVSLRLSRAISFKERFSLQGYVEIINLFNRVNINQINNVFADTNGTFSLPPQENGRFIVPKENYRSAFAPRQCQLGIKLIF